MASICLIPQEATTTANVAEAVRGLTDMALLRPRRVARNGLVLPMASGEWRLRRRS